MKERLALFILAAVITSGAVFAFQNPTTDPRTKPPGDTGQTGQKNKMQDKMSSKATMSDSDFVMKAAKDGMAEVALGQMAVTKASSEDVKKFAQRMVDDHSKANSELMQLAQSKSITLPTESDVKMDPDNKAMTDKLSGLSGAEFDREYMHHMVMDHQKAVALFESKAKSKDGDDNVENWAEKTLPTLKEHLRMAKDTAKKVGAHMPSSATSTNKQ